MSVSQDCNNDVLLLFDNRVEHGAVGTIIFMNCFKVHPLGSAVSNITNDDKEDNEYKLNMSKIMDNIIISYSIESEGNNRHQIYRSNNTRLGKHYSQGAKYPYAHSVCNAMVETIGLGF